MFPRWGPVASTVLNMRSCVPKNAVRTRFYSEESIKLVGESALSSRHLLLVLRQALCNLSILSLDISLVLTPGTSFVNYISVNPVRSITGTSLMHRFTAQLLNPEHLFLVVQLSPGYLFFRSPQYVNTWVFYTCDFLIIKNKLHIWDMFNWI